MIEILPPELFAIWYWLVQVQREISADIAATLRSYSASGDWRILLGFAPWAVVFGAAPALTPRHSKTVLTLYLGGTGARMGVALRRAMTLAVVHISSSVVIVLLSLPVVSMARGEAGRALVLEDISRALLGVVGLWLIWSAMRPAHTHSPRSRNTSFAVFAGLIPGPLTLFVMTFAFARGVPGAGIAFAAMMVLGVGAVLCTVAAATVLTRARLGTAARRLGPALGIVSRVILALTGVLLMAVAIQKLCLGG